MCHLEVLQMLGANPLMVFVSLDILRGAHEPLGLCLGIELPWICFSGARNLRIEQKEKQ